LLWWAGTLLLASAAVHGVVAVVDGSSWWGPVSWRKPVTFGCRWACCSGRWSGIMRQLPDRWWVRVSAGLAGVSSSVEGVLIAMQRWRGVASRFNRATPFDAGVWSAIGMLIIPLTLGVSLLLVAALVRFRRTASRVAVVAGLAAILAAGAIGRDMAAIGEAAFAATGQVPRDELFGAAGSAKLAHFVGLHALQVLALIAIGLNIGRLPARAAGVAMLVAGPGLSGGVRRRDRDRICRPGAAHADRTDVIAACRWRAGAGVGGGRRRHAPAPPRHRRARHRRVGRRAMSAVGQAGDQRPGDHLWAVAGTAAGDLRCAPKRGHSRAVSPSNGYRVW
jgi:hypothetical protein